MTAQYSIGIDLGTSNCALAYTRLGVKGAEPQVLPVRQWLRAGEMGEIDTLPSFAWLPPQSDEAASTVVGKRALEESNSEPGRVVRSAKSWLCHGGVDRESDLLPFGSDVVAERERISPVHASALYLSHLREVWNTGLGREPGAEFDAQVIVITVPASFDAAAQRLTREAARMAGYPETVRLIEEPQAAFLAWMGPEGSRRDRIAELGLERGDHVLVCDVGGGTSDFSLFAWLGEEGGEESTGPEFERVDVSDHILIGGDNIDLALAKCFEQSMGAEADALSKEDWGRLLSASRRLKEQLFSADLSEANASDREHRIALSGGGGSGLLAAAKSLAVKEQVLLDLIEQGFFPNCDARDPIQTGEGGLRELGLPYPEDPAITRHLAAFLGGRKVRAVLFNGGTFKADRLRARVLDSLTQWQVEGEAPQVLVPRDLDLGVALGAAHYGLANAGTDGAMIRAGLSRGFYLEVEASKKTDVTNLVCVLPKGIQPGERVRLNKLDLHLRINGPVSFKPFHSRLRERDHAGQLLRLNEKDYAALPDMESFMRLEGVATRKVSSTLIPVVIEAELSELGWVEVSIVSRSKALTEPVRWRLEFNIRQVLKHDSGQGLSDEDQPEIPEIADADFSKIENLLSNDFSPRILKEMEGILGSSRVDWNPVWLRRFWETLSGNMSRRARSPEIESTWLNAAGFFLRPGRGVSFDEERMRMLWVLPELGLAHPQAKQNWEQYFILWRRVSAGLTEPQQETLAAEHFELATSGVKRAAEAVRMIGSFERLDSKRKRAFFDALLEYLENCEGKRAAPWLWSLGRLLSRVPLYAAEERVVSAEWVSIAMKRLDGVDWDAESAVLWQRVLLWAGRKTGQRMIDLPAKVCAQIVSKLEAAGMDEARLKPLNEVVPLDRKEIQLQYGEALPQGLKIGQS